jgi:hypothetical protein
LLLSYRFMQTTGRQLLLHTAGSAVQFSRSRHAFRCSHWRCYWLLQLDHAGDLRASSNRYSGVKAAASDAIKNCMLEYIAIARLENAPYMEISASRPAPLIYSNSLHAAVSCV